jgi:hypothetical protein
MVKGQETAENIVSYGTSVSLATKSIGWWGAPRLSRQVPKASIRARRVPRFTMVKDRGRLNASARSNRSRCITAP